MNSIKALDGHTIEIGAQFIPTLRAELTSTLIGLARRSQDVAAPPVDLDEMIQDALDSAIALRNADFGNVQLYDPASRTLRIVAQRGFGQDFLDHFRVVALEDGSACAQALKTQRVVRIDDVQLDPEFEPHREIAARTGFRSVESRPLTSESGVVLGVLSLHFAQPRRADSARARTALTNIDS